MERSDSSESKVEQSNMGFLGLRAFGVDMGMGLLGLGGLEMNLPSSQIAPKAGRINS